MTPPFQNPVFERTSAGDYEAGWQLYQSIQRPSPDDDRWAGFCLNNLRRLLEAKDLLSQARGRGCEAAAVDLAAVCRQLGEDQVGTQLLESLDTSAFTSFDYAFLYREWGTIHYTAGRLDKAIEAFEHARMKALEAPQGHVLLPGIAQVLGLTYSARGLDHRAIHYLNGALEVASHAKCVYLLYARALCFIHMAQYESAQQDLNRARSIIDHAPLATSVLRYASAALDRARGLYSSAAQGYAEATSFAQGAEQPDTECHALLGACAVETATDQLNQARAHLARAKALAKGPKTTAFATLREGALMARLGDPEAIAVLESALKGFQLLGLEREIGWTWLHLAEARLRTGRVEDGVEALKHATDARHALGSGAALMMELRALPVAFDHLLTLAEDEYAYALVEDWRHIQGGTPMRLRLVTLGQVRLEADGHAVSLRFARALEIIAYCLANPGKTLEQLQAAAFPEEGRNSRNYLHQMRLELGRLAIGLTVAYDRKTRTYSVACQGPSLSWDLDDLKRLLSAGGDDGLVQALEAYKGPFLPHAESEWARLERESVQWTMVKFGLETMNRWWEAGEYKKCLNLAGRLIEIDPLDEALSEYLVRATLALEGAIAARRTLERESARYKSEVGEEPPGLGRLRRDLVSVN